jgi:muconate cycloisomerase
MSSGPEKLEILHSAIPMRSFEHAAAARDLAEAVLVHVVSSDGGEGWGETLPRLYVTGETTKSVTQDIEQIYWPALREGPLPEQPLPGRTTLAARCAVQLAWEDCQARSAGVRLCRPIDRCVRGSGSLGSSDPGKTNRRLLLLRIYGVRDFKLKLGLGADVDKENLRLVHKRLSRRIAEGVCSLRVDVNGAWAASEVPQRVGELRQYGVCAVEQPAILPAAELAEMAQRCPLPLMADESLLSLRDAEAILRIGGGKLWPNIRLSKNGGLDLCQRLCEMAQQANVPFAVGCMVGESGILSAAQRVLLGRVPPPRFVEGNFGRFLMRDDLTQPSPLFGYGGRLRPFSGPGLGVRVRPQKMARYARLAKTLSL